MRRGGLKLIGYLNDAHNNFVWIAIPVHEVEFYHGIVFSQLILHMNDLIVLQMFFDIALQNKQSIGEIDFKGTGIVG